MEPTITPAVSYKKYIVGGVLLLIVVGGVYAYRSNFAEEPIVVEKHQETQATTSAVTSVATSTAPTIMATTSAVSKYKHNDGISDEERSLVIESKVRMFEVLSSRDIIKIRAYLNEGIKASGDEKQLSDISNLSDKNLLSMVNMIIDFGFPGINNTQDLKGVLLSDKTVWTKDIKNGFEHVSIKIDSPVQGAVSGTLTLEAFKFGNVWY
ncbi:MAG: hypothetical protein RLY57_531 [Candidatus Parcubacteria bacterium]|jgi:hypothetical protein